VLVVRVESNTQIYWIKQLTYIVDKYIEKFPDEKTEYNSLPQNGIIESEKMGKLPVLDDTNRNRISIKHYDTTNFILSVQNYLKDLQRVFRPYF
jgi:hypothetical protein